MSLTVFRFPMFFLEDLGIRKTGVTIIRLRLLCARQIVHITAHWRSRGPVDLRGQALKTLRSGGARADDP